MTVSGENDLNRLTTVDGSDGSLFSDIVSFFPANNQKNLSQDDRVILGSAEWEPYGLVK